MTAGLYVPMARTTPHVLRLTDGRLAIVPRGTPIRYVRVDAILRGSDDLDDAVRRLRDLAELLASFAEGEGGR